jgi:mono/diheme cytochrome c family protein
MEVIMFCFNRYLIRVAVLIGISAVGITAHASSAKQLVEAQCAACHALTVPDQAALTLQEKIDRKGPPLYYAGQKYQQQWLANWLQQPTRITPSGGEFWSNAVVVTDEGDEVDEAKLQPHMALNAADAKAASDYLMTLVPFPELTPASGYKPGKVNKMLAEKDFRKFKGCAGCHRDEPDFGGVTGPELYTAMNRLQPDFVASYIANPKAWDPHTLMPVRDLNDPSIFKLMNYLNQIKEPQQ